LIEQANAEAKKDEARIEEARQEARAEKDKQQKVDKEAALQEMIRKSKAKGKRGVPSKGLLEQLVDCFKLFCLKSDSKAASKVVPFGSLSKEGKIRESKMRRLEFLEKQTLFKFYLATNFYEDNIGTVEIAQRSGSESKLITASFMIPAYTKHLTDKTRDAIPAQALGVS
jgi:hypothetical protein